MPNRSRKKRQRRRDCLHPSKGRDENKKLTACQGRRCRMRRKRNPNHSAFQNLAAAREETILPIMTVSKRKMKTLQTAAGEQGKLRRKTLRNKELSKREPWEADSTGRKQNWSPHRQGRREELIAARDRRRGSLKSVLKRRMTCSGRSKRPKTAASYGGKGRKRRKIKRKRPTALVHGRKNSAGN